jgi:hypothetical protein
MSTKTGRAKTLFCLLLVIIPLASYGQTLSLTAELDQEEIWLGETVRLTITLSGSEDAFEPVLLLPGVKVEALGGSRRSSESVTSINGKVTRQVSLAYVYAFDLTPNRSGTVAIPPVDLEVGGQRVTTRPFSLEVKQPRLSDDYHLLLDLTPSRQYVDAELRLRVTFLFAVSVRNLSFVIPELGQHRYTDLNPGGNTEKYQIDVNGARVVFRRDDQRYKGTDYAGITAEFSVRPMIPGTMDFSTTTARFETIVGTERVRDMFGRIQEQPAYGSLAVAAYPSLLEILPFPAAGKPRGFNGFSGDVRVSVSAEPLRVHIGDPITLVLTFTGLQDPELDIPPLEDQLGPGFNTPATRSEDTIVGNRKTVTQTIRVIGERITEIPALVFPYFDSKSEEYRTASTNAIALELLETEVVTAAQLEGGDDSATAVQAKTLLERSEEGIYYNYTGSRILDRNRPLTSVLRSSPFVWFSALLPPVAFLAMIVITILLPKVRLRVSSRRNMKASVAAMAKRIKSLQAGTPREYLRESNRELVGFCREQGISYQAPHLRSGLAELNKKLYNPTPVNMAKAKSIVGELLVSLAKGGTT